MCTSYKLVFAVLSSVVFSVYCDLGDNCRTNKGQNGTCTTIEKCVQAMDELRNNVHPTVCGFRGKESYVCCEFTSLGRAGNIANARCNQYNPSKVRVSGILGGVRSASAEFPHMVALGFGDQNDIKWNCGGSLISENYVLTAAHCIDSPYDGEVKYIRAGTTTLLTPEDTYQDFRVAEIIPHPSYQPPMKYHDIALIKLDQPVKFTGSIRPACLQTSFEIDGNLSAIGWGHLYHGGNPSNDLMKVGLIKYSYFECNKVFSKDVKALPEGIKNELMVCAGGNLDEEKDTCQGDSGGPLQITTKRQHTIVGITSFGKICGTPKFPGVYTRVSNYIEWIEKIVWS